VLARDPLARGIGIRERVRRLGENLDSVAEELRTCMEQRFPDDAGLVEARAVLKELEEAREQHFGPKAPVHDTDEIVQGMVLFERAESARSRICAGVKALDRALTLMMKKHGIGNRE